MKNKNIVKISLLLTLFALIGCSKDAPTPTNEQEDKGHDSASKIEVFSLEVENNNGTYVRTNNVQKVTFTEKGDSGLVLEGSSFQWEIGKYYLLEIVYYNTQNERMNHEFVTPQMAPIHQHFFRMENKTATEMDEYLTYTYQDTNPENGYLGENGVSLRKRTWDSQNPTADDPIGLKGVFYVKKNNLTFNLRITLAHFMGADRGFNKLKNGEVQKYNVLPSANFFASDLDVVLPIQILN